MCLFVVLLETLQVIFLEKLDCFVDVNVFQTLGSWLHLQAAKTKFSDVVGIVLETDEIKFVNTARCLGKFLIKMNINWNHNEISPHPCQNGYP